MFLIQAEQGSHFQGADLTYEFDGRVLHVFFKSGSLYVPTAKTCRIMMVGGGGSGGASTVNNDVASGGGGGGRVCYHSGFSVPTGHIDVRVGRGGPASANACRDTHGVFHRSQSGEQTSIQIVSTLYVAAGGGSGGSVDNHQRAEQGGSGGGGGSRNSNGNWNSGAPSKTFGGLSGWNTYGNSGGNGVNSNSSGGGGGGAGGSGSAQQGGANSSSSQGGTGGAGYDMSNWVGEAIGHKGWFAGGGGGGTYRHGTDAMYQAPPNGGS